MPSISQEKLKTLEDAATDAEAWARREQEKAGQALQRLRSYDTVLDKIVRAADGRPLTDDRNAPWGYGSSIGYADDPRFPPSDDERRERQTRELTERIVNLEARLAAVKAVAQFAKEHKA